jgi:1-deoxyxylulose-5-phosphate synthase
MPPPTVGEEPFGIGRSQLRVEAHEGCHFGVTAMTWATPADTLVVSMAWVLKNPVVSAPTVGATKPHHLTDAVAALDLQLTDKEITTLKEHYTPRPPTSF